MPNILRVTWPRPRPFSRFFFASFGDIATVRLHPKFQVSISTRFGDKLGCAPKIMGVTWPRPRPFSRFFFAGFGDIATMRLLTTFQVSTPTRFGDKLGCTPKIMGSRDLGHAPFLHFSLLVLEILSLCVSVPNFKSLSLLVSEIC